MRRSKNTWWSRNDRRPARPADQQRVLGCLDRQALDEWRALRLLFHRRVAQMNQSRTASLIEACVNVVIGLGINWIANMLILPLFGFNITGTQALNMGLIFTVISIARSYVIRRWFNARLQAAAQKIARAVK